MNHCTCQPPFPSNTPNVCGECCKPLASNPPPWAEHLTYTPLPPRDCPHDDYYCGLNGQCGRCVKDHADWGSNALGIIGDSADKQFTFVRTDGKTRGRPTHFIVLDWNNSLYLTTFPEVRRLRDLATDVLHRSPLVPPPQR